MIAKHFKCQNFGRCPLADTQEPIFFDEEGHFQCKSGSHTECPTKNPKCRDALVAVEKPAGPKVPLPVLVGISAVLFLMVSAMAVGSCGKSTPKEKEKAIAAELKKIWPWLTP